MRSPADSTGMSRRIRAPGRWLHASLEDGHITRASGIVSTCCTRPEVGLIREAKEFPEALRYVRMRYAYEYYVEHGQNEVGILQSGRVCT